MPLRSIERRATGSTSKSRRRSASCSANGASAYVRRSRHVKRPSTSSNTAGDDPPLRLGNVGEVVGERQLVGGVRQHEIVREERVALVDEPAFELLLEIIEIERVELLDDRRPTEALDALLGRHVGRLDRGARRVGAEESAQPPRHVLPRVVRVLADLLARDLPEDPASAERRAAPRELSVRAEDQRRRPAVHLAVVHVVRELVEVDVALLPARCLRWVREDAREALVRAVRFERELGLRVDDELLLERERQLLVYLARDEDLLLRVLEVVANEDRGVLLAEVATREGLEREEKREADLTALRDPAKSAPVLEERDLVRLELDGLVVIRRKPRDEAPLAREPLGELLLGALDDGEGHRRFALIVVAEEACIAT
jgi:hypothetical protein